MQVAPRAPLVLQDAGAVFISTNPRFSLRCFVRYLGGCMIDIELIREKPELVKASMVKRNMDPALVEKARSQDAKRRELLVEVETLKAERNKVSKEIGGN